MTPEEASPTPTEGGKSNGESRAPRKLGELQKTITMAQIAKAAGVSQGAISSLLNDRDYGIRVSEKTRERVFKVCRDMGYIPNDLRAVVRMYPELGEFCLLISTEIEDGLSDPFVARLAHASMKAITDPSHPLSLAFYDPRQDYSGDLESLPYPVRSGVASKFLFFGAPSTSLLHQILRRGLPVISFGSEIRLPGVVSLVPDYVSGSRIAIEHLFQLGHRHIAIVSGPFGTTDSQIIELHRGVKLAYDALGVPIEAQNIVYGDLSYRAGVAALDELLTHPLKPTAVFCLGDAAAAGVMAEAQQRGLRVPQDLSVVGCSDDYCSCLMLPQLTTVHIPAEEMAEMGVREIDRLVKDGAALRESEKRMLPVRLVERGSAAAPAENA
jgi:DNA-binding LacI/PurR family transcriptional regulator